MIDPLVAVRAVHFAATVMAGGGVFFRLWVAPVVRLAGGNPIWRIRLDAQLDRIAWTSLALVVVSAATWLLLVAADMSNRPPAMLTRDVIATVLASTRFGHVWMARLGLAVVLALCLWPSQADDRPVSARRITAALLAAALLGALAPAGHAGATAGMAGVILLVSDAAHAIAAATWVGGLVPLALLLAAARSAADGASLAAVRAATRRFSNFGLVSVATLLATGSVDAIFLVGSVPALLGTAYGQLLSAKILLFAMTVGIAAVNRLKLTPRLAESGAADAMRGLQRNGLAEATLGLLIVAIVAALGTIPPGLHVEHAGRRFLASLESAAIDYACSFMPARPRAGAAPPDPPGADMTTEDGNASNDLLAAPPRVVNVGLELFAADLARLGARVVHVQWSPPAGGNAQLAGLLAKLRS